MFKATGIELVVVRYNYMGLCPSLCKASYILFIVCSILCLSHKDSIIWHLPFISTWYL